MNSCAASLAIWACLTMTACNTAQPVQPSGLLFALPSRLDLKLGPQSLHMIGLNFPGDPEVPLCVSLGAPPSSTNGTSVLMTVQVSHEGSDWVARSASPGADSIELRFHETQAGGNIPVAGTVRGSAADTTSLPPLYLPPESRVTFIAPPGSSDVSVDGTGDPHYSYVGGRMIGSIRFSDSHGDTWACTAILWTLVG